MLTFVFTDTGIVFITKLAFWAPAGITTLDGTNATSLFEANAIAVSTAATPLRVTVPID
jgi:hypothetical protein